MANPQLENGYMRIATELIEALARVCVGGSVRQIVDVVIRKTYGFNKKDDRISIDQFKKATGLSRRSVIYAVQEAEAKRLIFVIRKKILGGKNEVNSYRFNKDYDLWVVQNSALQVENNRTVAKVSSAKLRKEVKKQVGSAKLGNLVVQNSVNDVRSFAPTIDTITINITKDMYNYEEVDIDGNPTKKKRLGRITKVENDFLISIGFLWLDLIKKELGLEDSEVPLKNIYYPVRSCYDREKFTSEDFEGLFKYFFRQMKQPEQKLSFDLCLSEKFVKQYLVSKKTKKHSFAEISSDIRL